MNIDNIHEVRNSWNALMKLCQEKYEGDDFLVKVFETGITIFIQTSNNINNHNNNNNNNNDNNNNNNTNRMVETYCQNIRRSLSNSITY